MKKYETEWYEIEWLENQEACDEAIEWLKGKSLKRAWEMCPRGDWMLWLVARCEHDRPTLVLCTCECARLVLANVPDGEDRPRIAIETAEAWTRGDASIDDCKHAANAAWIVCAASVNAAKPASRAASYAACTISSASHSAACAADAADAAASAAWAAGARLATLKQCAKIARKYFPEAPVIPGG